MKTPQERALTFNTHIEKSKRNLPSSPTIQFNNVNILNLYERNDHYKIPWVRCYCSN